MPNRTKDRQTYLANPHESYKTTRYGDKPITHRVSSAYDQSTLSQFGFTPSSSSASSKKHKRKSLPSKSGGVKRRSLNFDDLKDESSGEEEREDGNPVGKKRRVGQGRLSSDDEDENNKREIKEEDMAEDSFVVNDQFDEDDEESWRPRRSPKRRRPLPKRRTFQAPKTRDLTLTQMHPLTRITAESDYENDEESQGEYTEGDESQEDDLNIPVEDIQVKGEPVSQGVYEPEAWIKDEPQSQAEMPEDLILNQHVKQENEDIELSDQARVVKLENLADEVTEEPTATMDSDVLGLLQNPKTPKRPIPQVVPSSYTPPVTPLSPLRHQQLSAILASPSVQRQWRTSGRKLPGFIVPDLSPVTEHQKKIDDSSTEENTPVEPIAPAQPLKRPDFTGGSGRSPGSSVKETEPAKPRVVPSTQWWEREETLTLNSTTTLEPIQEVDSQPDVQVGSSGDVQDNEAASNTTTAPQVLQPIEREVVPESPVRRNRLKNRSFKPSLSTSISREPLLRDSSGLHTINTSFFRKESSTIEPPPQAVESESQKSQISIKSVDRQLMNESNNHNKIAANGGEETQLDIDELDSDATISQSQPEELEITPQAPVRKPTLPSRKSSGLPLLPPSSPPQTYKFPGNINSTPPSSKDIFHSPSSKGSSSPIMEFKNTLETFEPQEGEGGKEDSNEATAASTSYGGKGPVETLTQWKMRMFGPSQAVPTISQILGANSLADDDEEDDEEL
ncbi:hypothetical protein TWF102_008444 [Orbilia oligospora]|uniref:Uncharacterized protein n=1 Tax=Orbilia oligospora TaxID=2813651 RepID=A0A7C8JHK8_ORBOL|nr:hypothetical protein TWF102_008444 [Orbilia oligospora]KAF3114702.1 hypothetical protein TWF103_000439 [Orbilia oligospora]